MKTLSPFFSRRNIRLIVTLAITIAILAAIFIIPDSKPYSILLTSLLTVFCIIILAKIKIANRDFFKSHTDRKEFKHITANTFLFDQLTKMNCAPEHDGNDIIFHYHAGNFKALWLDHKIIRIVYPCIYITTSNQYSLISEIVNEINADYVLVKAITVPHSNNADILIHVIADFYYTSDNKDTSILIEILTQCLEIQIDLLKEIASSKSKPHIITPPLNSFSLN